MSITPLHAGPRMSQAVTRGDTVHLAGRVADKAKGKSVGDRVFAEAGSDKTKILSAPIELAGIATFAEINAVWAAWVPAAQAPARAKVESRLAAPAYSVEIACIAARD